MCTTTKRVNPPPPLLRPCPPEKTKQKTYNSNLAAVQINRCTWSSVPSGALTWRKPRDESSNYSEFFPTQVTQQPNARVETNDSSSVIQIVSVTFNIL